MMESLEALRVISRYRGDAIVVATMTANFEWSKVSTNPDFDLLFYGTMGKASSMGLGLALARPDKKVIVLDGDGSLLMNLGTLVTIAHMAPPNFIHFLCENRVYRVSGGQPTPCTDEVNYAGLARSAGYPNVYEFDTVPGLEKTIENIIRERGPTFVCLKVTAIREHPHLTQMPTILARFKAALHRSL